MSSGCRAPAGPKKAPGKWTVVWDVVVLTCLVVIGIGVVGAVADGGSTWDWVSFGLLVVGVTGWAWILVDHLNARRKAVAAPG